MPTPYDPFRPHSVASAQPLVRVASAPVIEPVLQGTVPEVLSWVNENKERAQRALAAEQQSERPRKKLVEQLGAVLGD